MTIVQIISSTPQINDAPDSTPSGNWNGFASTIPIQFTDGLLQGYCLNWTNVVETTVLNSFNNLGYAGYTTNFNTSQDVSLGSFQNIPYGGFTTNYSAAPLIENRAANEQDKDSVIDYPKDQTIYYKLKGYNPLTQTWEVWVIKKLITSRPEQFDHGTGRNPPNLEKDVFKTAPSGNALVNISIVGRWIE